MNISENYSICRRVATQQAYPSYHRFTTILNGAPVISCILLGAVGNILATFLIKKGRIGGAKQSNSLICLALWDTILLIGTLFYFPPFALSVPASVCGYLTLLTHPLVSTAYLMSTWSILLITVQRYLAVSRPLMRQRTSCAKLSIPIWLSLFGILFNIPTALELKLADCFDELKDQWTIEIGPTPLRVNAHWLRYRMATKLIFSSVVPFSVVIVFTIMLIIRLHRSNVNRRKMTRQESVEVSRQLKRERFTSITLLVIMSKFIVANCLPVIIDIWEVFGYESNFASFMYLIDISNFLVVLNSATNCLVYIRYKRLAETRATTVKCAKSVKFTPEEVAHLTAT